MLLCGKFACLTQQAPDDFDCQKRKWVFQIKALTSRTILSNSKATQGFQYSSEAKFQTQNPLQYIDVEHQSAKTAPS